MNESFTNLKKKCLISAIIKSLIFALSAGLFVAGIFILAFELSDKPLHWAFYLLIGFVTAGAVFAVSFMLMRPTDMKVAKKYDAEYGLNEKLQTMVAFSNVESDIVKLQREDALEKLACIPARKPQFKNLWYYFVIALLALAMIFSAVFVPAAAQTGGGIDDPDNPNGETPGSDDPEEDNTAFEYDLYMQSAVGELILNVRESSLAADLKSNIVTTLETLDAYLTTVDTQNDMKSAVITAVTVIDGTVYQANSFRSISRLLLEFDENLPVGIYRSIAVYNQSNVALTDFSRVKAFEGRLGDLIQIALEEPLAKSCAALKVSQSGVKDEETGEVITLGGVLNGYAANLASVLEEIDDETDEICAALDKLRIALKTVVGKIGKLKDPQLFSEIDGAYTTLNTDLNIALSTQCYNCIMNMFVREKLAAIFGIQIGELPSFNEDLVEDDDTENNENGGGDDEKEDNENGNGGGGGNGHFDFIYGSDDKIYDRELNDYVSYGEFIKNNSDLMYNRNLAGELPDDLYNVLQTYFEILSSAIKNDSADE